VGDNKDNIMGSSTRTGSRSSSAIDCGYNLRSKAAGQAEPLQRDVEEVKRDSSGGGFPDGEPGELTSQLRAGLDVGLSSQSKAGRASLVHDGEVAELGVRDVVSCVSTGETDVLSAKVSIGDVAVLSPAIGEVEAKVEAVVCEQSKDVVEISSAIGWSNSISPVPSAIEGGS
jgi:hypothetical protein